MVRGARLVLIRFIYRGNETLEVFQVTSSFIGSYKVFQYCASKVGKRINTDL